MSLSTSSSETQSLSRDYTRPIVITVVILLLFLIALEIGTRVGFSRISHIESRVNIGHAAALAARKGGPSHPTILLLGNSLLLEGVEYTALQQQLGSRADPILFAIEQTQYLDWYYGIRRLLDDGSRPDRIVLSMNLRHLTSDAIRGEYSAAYLFRTRDLKDVGSDINLNLTGISDLLFARYSMFYAGRLNVRNFSLGRIAPAYSTVLHNLNNTPKRAFSNAETLAIAAPRLAKLREACAEYQVDFDFLLPPGFEESSEGLLEAARQSGTSVLMPVPQNSWPADLYRDAFHLNHEGSVRFTKILSSTLLKQIEPRH